MNHRKKLNAISSVILTFLILMTVVIAIMGVMVGINSLVNLYSSALDESMRHLSQYRMGQIIINRTGDYILFTNIGPSDIVVDKVVIRTITGDIEVKDVTTLCDHRVIPSMGNIRCSFTRGEYIAFILPDGVVLYPEEPLIRAQHLVFNSTRIILSMFDVGTMGDLQARFNVTPELIAKPYPTGRAVSNYTGMNSTFIPLLQWEFNNTSIVTPSTGIPFGIVVVGLDPSWVVQRAQNPQLELPPRFSILLAVPRINETIQISGQTYGFPSNGARLVINNFTGTIRIIANNTVIACSSSMQGICNVNKSAIGLWYYGLRLGMRIQLNGTASYIGNYTRSSPSSSPTRSTSYLPYLFIGDIDSNGSNDLLFITEDVNYGTNDAVNDRDTWNSIDIVDWSTRPLVLRLTQIGVELGSPDGSIDGRVIGGLILFINVIFHDNSFPDDNQLNDIQRTDWVLRILLIDENGNEILIREYRYQEICLYHKTLVVDFDRDNYFTKISQSIFVNIPEPRRYWLAMSIQDPYRAEGNTNDADFTIGIELIGVLPIQRY